tara:strand:- start:86 stop:715 length:630 start_codon:yes stop_codon:yes gene_type:complete
MFLPFMLVTTVSKAASVEGFTIGASLGEFAAYAHGKETTNGNTSYPDAERITEEDGAFKHDYGAIFIEASLGGASLGLSYVPMVIETPQNTNTKNGSKNTAKAEIENLTTLYLLVPMVAGIYGKAGISIADIKSVENLATSSATFGDSDTTGFNVGLGWQADLEDGMGIRAEIGAAVYDDVTVTGSNSSKLEFTDMMSAQATISVLKSF